LLLSYLAARSAAADNAIALLLLLLLGCWSSHVHSHTEVSVLHDAQPGIKAADSSEVARTAEHGLIACMCKHTARCDGNTCVITAGLVTGSQTYSRRSGVHEPVLVVGAWAILMFVRLMDHLQQLLVLKHVLTKQCAQAAQI
jgi:hypothetical protein